MNDNLLFISVSSLFEWELATPHIARHIAWNCRISSPLSRFLASPLIVWHLPSPLIILLLWLLNSSKLIRLLNSTPWIVWLLISSKLKCWLISSPLGIWLLAFIQLIVWHLTALKTAGSELIVGGLTETPWTIRKLCIPSLIVH